MSKIKAIALSDLHLGDTESLLYQDPQDRDNLIEVTSDKINWIAGGNGGDWPMWRHDGHLTAYQPLPGSMKAPPEVLARYFLGVGNGAVTPADLSNTGTEQEFLIVARARLFAYNSQGYQLWECNPTGYWLQQIAYVADLDGDGENEVVALAGNLGGTRWAFLIIKDEWQPICWLQM